MKKLYKTKSIKKTIETTFSINISNIKYVNSGYDSEAYLVNKEYIFKIGRYDSVKNSYYDEKQILDYLNENLTSSITIPKIEYFNVTNKSIIGEKEIKGTFLSPKIYQKMPDNKKEKLAEDLAVFLKVLHSLDTTEINAFTNEERIGKLKDLEFLRVNIFKDLNFKETDYIENLFNKINSYENLFNGKKCFCHNDLSCNHIILSKNYKLIGIIDFGDACITNEYADFMYLLSNSTEEVGRDFGLKVLKYYGELDIDNAITYSELKKEYYPVECILWGIKNGDKELLKEGLKALKCALKEV